MREKTMVDFPSGLFDPGIGLGTQRSCLRLTARTKIVPERKLR
jgi:hypothetical protein